MSRQLKITTSDGLVQTVDLPEENDATLAIGWSVQVSPDGFEPHSKTFALAGVESVEIVTAKPPKPAK